MCHGQKLGRLSVVDSTWRASKAGLYISTNRELYTHYPLQQEVWRRKDQLSLGRPWLHHQFVSYVFLICKYMYTYLHIYIYIYGNPQKRYNSDLSLSLVGFYFSLLLGGLLYVWHVCPHICGLFIPCSLFVSKTSKTSSLGGASPRPITSSSSRTLSPSISALWHGHLQKLRDLLLFHHNICLA